MVDRIVQWLHRHDRGYAALRRAGRTAIVMPALLALSVKVFDNAVVALFSAFGSFALLLLVDFSGRMRSRLEAQIGLSVAGAVLICVGTLASRAIWSAVLVTAVVGFVVIMFGVVSSVLAGATTSLLLAFILPVATQAPPSAIPDRLAGWGLAAGASFLALWQLWPSPDRSPLRVSAATACRALAARLSRESGHSANDNDSRGAESDLGTLEPVNVLQRQFLATQWAPNGLGASDRALVRLVDEISWMSNVVAGCDDQLQADSLRELSRSVQRASADVLTESATLLESRLAPIIPLVTARTSLNDAIAELQRHSQQHLLMSDSTAPESAPPVVGERPVDRFLSSLEFSFHCREIGYVAQRIAADVERAITAERRKFFDRVLGHEILGVSPWASARARITSHLHRHSVWLHNSLRGATGLALALLIAEEVGIEHSFWVIFGTLSVLRSSALSTGQNALRAVVGTLIGFIIGAGVVELVGTNVTLLWFLLPLVLFVAGVAPAAISFAAGQAGFTLTLVILFNILEPVGWSVGLVRLEDIVVGTAVSAGVALLFWPRGAAGELGAAMHDAYTTSVELLATATDVRPSAAVRPMGRGDSAAGASRRLDDVFRTYLAERGAKPVPFADVATLVTGVSILRFSADAVAEYGDHHLTTQDEWTDARQRVAEMSTSIVGWYREFASRFQGESAAGQLSPQTIGGDLVINAVRDQLVRTSAPDLEEAMRILWTADQLAAVERLEVSVDSASRVAEALWGSGSSAQPKTDEPQRRSNLRKVQRRN
jgi:uncharacterized membrane protein YccC